MKKLLLMNGRWGAPPHSPGSRVYVAAYSKADANRMLMEYLSHSRSFIHEINTFYNIGRWGIPMDGIVPERGIWIIEDCSSKPVKVF